MEIDGYYPIEISKDDIETDPTSRCGSFSILMQEPETAEHAFTYFSYGAPVSVFLTVTVADIAPDGTTAGEKQTPVFKREPLSCAFGFANPGY